MLKPSKISIAAALFLSLLITPAISANETESTFIRAGLVDVNAIDKSIRVDLVNSDPGKNYFRENYYQGLQKAYLQKEIALKLAQAQKNLKSRHSGYSLLVSDAARPRSVSRQMYEKMKGTHLEKFVANPKKGSMHNYAIAVDITIVNGDGEELDMGFNPFRKSKLALYWSYALKKIGKSLTAKQKNNRQLLADVMTSAGFIALHFEWWHFNGMPKNKARTTYKIIE